MQRSFTFYSFSILLTYLPMLSESGSQCQQKPSKSSSGSSSGGFFGPQHARSADVIDDLNDASLEANGALQVWIEGDCPVTKRLSACARQQIESEVFTVGRRRSFVDGNYEVVPDLLITQEEPFSVSRVHCSIEVEESGVVVRDMRSRLGTLVNGERLGGPTARKFLTTLERGEHQIVLGSRRGGLRLRLTVA